MNTYQLFFGRSLPNGGIVSDFEWETFVKDQICSLFAGFTIQPAIGYWKGKQEQTMIVTISTNDQRSIEDLAREYKQIFFQDSVAILTLRPLPPLHFI